MKLSRVIFVASLLFVALMVGTAGIATVQTTQEEAWPRLRSTNPTSQEEIAAIKEVIERSYTVLGQASHTFDLSQFQTVFANDPAVPLDKGQSDYLARVGAARRAGWLDYKVAFFEDWGRGAEALERLEATAKSEGRLVTSDELRSITGPGMPPAARGVQPTQKTSVRLMSVTVDGTRAEVQYDDNAVTYLLALSKTKDGWRIVGERVLDVHV